MLYCARGSEGGDISREEMEAALARAFGEIGKKGKLEKVLALPPDVTGFHSRAGEITNFASRYFRERLTDILPALGTHAPLTDQEIDRMFGNIQHSLFRVHDWRRDLQTLGSVPADYVAKVSGGRVEYDWPAQVNSLLVRGGFDLILSIGQVVPHEVIGMDNHNKNIFVGAGGEEGIGKSHFLGAVYGMEKSMGRRDSPVRDVMNYASRHFAKELPIVYVLTVIGLGASGELALRGLFVGDDEECYSRAAELAARVNIRLLPKPLQKVVVYLEPAEFRSTWLGNKSIYRTRMAIADGGELLVLAPGLKEFGGDKTIDTLIRKYGYKGTPQTLRAVEKNADLKANLSVAAHLIHGSSEGRFTVTYCPGKLTREEIEDAGFRYEDIGHMMARYSPERLKDGWNTLPDGEEIYYISNPALGLWAWEKKFTEGK
ncbi:MAG: lactate racemase domain-containing protein [Spirochaetia bacterium]|jgi:nickel-dependent lactate racemase|nr:lactate racemase domain-containing protein [Spirochaetia bacterium]